MSEVRWYRGLRDAHTVRFPDYNFIGLVIGPRGMTQKQMEKDTNCKISIRGKGSEKDGRRADAEDDELHVLVSGDTKEEVRAAAYVFALSLMSPLSKLY